MAPTTTVTNRTCRIAAKAGGILVIACLALALLEPSGAVASTHHVKPGARRAHGHRAAGVGHGSSTSCAGGVCFSGDPFYLYAGQCTWYAAGRRPDLNGIVHGNAGDWLNEARGHVPEGRAAVVGAVAVWLPNTGGAFGAGHVAYVDAVSGGLVTVQDFNWGTPARSYHRHTVSAALISGYIYGGPAGSGQQSPPPTAAPNPGGVSPSSPDANPTAPAPTPAPGSTSAQPAPATPPEGTPSYVHHVTGTCRDGACGLTIRSGPGFSGYASLGSLGEAAEADVVCQALGQSVSNGYATSAVWDRLTSGGWVSDFYLDTPNIGTWSPPIPRC
jgi:surface antigen